jgi:antirestriction protein ArdC
VVYANRFVPSYEKQRAAETGEEAQPIPFLKRFTVFNADQCDGLSEEVATVAPPPPPGSIEPTVEALIKATGIDFRIGGNRGFYAPVEDYVQVPPPQAYFEPINWHRTALHELGHATGRDSVSLYGLRPVRFAAVNSKRTCAGWSGRRQATTDVTGPHRPRASDAMRRDLRSSG